MSTSSSWFHQRLQPPHDAFGPPTASSAWRATGRVAAPQPRRTGPPHGSDEAVPFWRGRTAPPSYWRLGPLPPDARASTAGTGRPRTGRSAWHWLLMIPLLLPLLTPVYNRLEPQLFGVPFFYWCQLAFVGVDILVIALVYQVTKRRV
jgi:Protein of unknown function (DUF3311)